MDVMGYADRLSARPGERIGFHVCCEVAEYHVDFVRFTRAFGPRLGSDASENVVPFPEAGARPGRFQAIQAGSHLVVPAAAGTSWSNGVTFQAWIYPTLPRSGWRQGIASTWSEEKQRGWAVLIDDNGQLLLTVGDGSSAIEVNASTPLLPKRWYAVAVSISPGRKATLFCRECARGWLAGGEGSAKSVAVGSIASGLPLVIGLGQRDGGGEGSGVSTRSAQRYNGKVDRPRLWERALDEAEIAALFDGGAPSADQLRAVWDPTQEIRSRRVPDVSGNGWHAEMVNLPSRGMTGANWTGREISYLAAADEYRAMRFHEDDLEDAKWEQDFAITIPADLAPGVYAARLRTGSTVEHVPFYVRPAPGRETAVLFLAPTNTYLAYGNEKLFRAAELDEMVKKTTDIEIQLTPREHFLADHPELGGSTYDRHADGSGTFFSSRLRPLLTMRPEFLNWMTGKPRHFSGDLFLIEWLERTGIPYDIATDEDVHLEGRSVFDPHRVVVTGSHPEYWTTPMMSAIEAYLSDGGRMMYLGGNGFYWVTGMDADYPHVVEIRRGRQGTRAWDSEPGEEYLQTAPEPGGLWRFRGKNPNTLVGVGFAAEGWGGAAGYDRRPESHDPKLAWLFDGIDADEVIGDFGLILGGAAGDEIDRYDLDQGTPAETIRLATTEGKHTDYYQLVVEDTGFLLPCMGGTEEPRVRADMTLLEGAKGGAVFSVGSITWSASLPHNNFDNNVARVTENVLRRFAQESP